MGLEDIYAGALEESDTFDTENPMRASRATSARSDEARIPENPMRATSASDEVRLSDVRTDAPPAGWQTCVDPDSGNSYLYCAATGESRWDEPTDDSTFETVNPLSGHAGAPPAPDAAPRPSVGIELQEVARQKPWGERLSETSPEEYVFWPHGRSS